MDFRRKNIRLHPVNYQGHTWFFITLCCESRKHVFSENKHAISLIDHLRKAADNCNFNVHAYCVMPHHFHALIEGTAPDCDLILFVRIFKQATSLEYSGGSGLPLWQKKFYDHILRAKDSPEAVSWYIWMNPVRKGLCSRPSQYSYSGSFTENWKKMVQPSEPWMPAWKRSQVARP